MKLSTFNVQLSTFMAVLLAAGAAFGAGLTLTPWTTTTNPATARSALSVPSSAELAAQQAYSQSLSNIQYLRSVNWTNAQGERIAKFAELTNVANVKAEFSPESLSGTEHGLLHQVYGENQAATALKTYSGGAFAGQSYYAPGSAYSGEYARDFSYAVEGLWDYFPPDAISNCVRRFITVQHTSGTTNGSFSDFIQPGNSLPYPFISFDTVADVMRLAEIHYEMTGLTNLFVLYQTQLSNSVAWLETHRTNHLIWCQTNGVTVPSPTLLHAGWGFQDRLLNTGYDLGASLAYFRALRSQGNLLAASGQQNLASNSWHKSDLVRYSLRTNLWDASFGLFFMASESNRVHSTTLSAACVSYGAVDADIALAISGWLRTNQSLYLSNGWVRHFPNNEGSLWVDGTFGASPLGISQHGGYWNFSHWVADAVRLTDAAEAERILAQAMLTTKATGAPEWFGGGIMSGTGFIQSAGYSAKPQDRPAGKFKGMFFGKFTGSAKGLTSIPAGQLTGTVAESRIDAAIARDSEIPAAVQDVNESGTNNFVAVDVFAENFHTGITNAPFTKTGPTGLLEASGSSNLFGPYTPQNWNFGNMKQVDYVLSRKLPLNVLHIRDDAINSDDQLIEALNTFLWRNGCAAGGMFSRLIWMVDSGVEVHNQSASPPVDHLWEGGYYKFKDTGGGITNCSYYGANIGAPYGDTFSFVYMATNNGATMSIYTNSGGVTTPGLLATVEGSHDRIADVVAIPEPLWAYKAGGAGRFNTVSATYVFHVYAYKDVQATRVYSENPAVITGTANSGFPAGNSYDMTLSWAPVDGALGYRVVIYSDPENSISNNRYYDVAATTWLVNESQYVTASPPTVTPKSAAYTGDMKPVGVVFKFPTVENCVVTIRSASGVGKTNVVISGGVRHSTQPMTYNIDNWGGGGGGWGIDTCFLTPMHTAIFREFVKTAKWDMLFLSDLGNPGRYLTQLRDMALELGLAIDIVATTANYANSAGRAELYTNAVYSGAVIVDTALMMDTQDPTKNWLYYTNGSHTPDGVHTRPFVKTNIMRQVFNVLGLNYEGYGRRYNYPAPQTTNYIELPISLARYEGGSVPLVHLYWAGTWASSPLGVYRTWGLRHWPNSYGFVAASYPLNSGMVGLGRTNVYWRGFGITTNLTLFNVEGGISGWETGLADPPVYNTGTFNTGTLAMGSSAPTTNTFVTGWVKVPLKLKNEWHGWIGFGGGSVAPAHNIYWTHFQLRVDPNDK